VRVVQNPVFLLRTMELPPCLSSKSFSRLYEGESAYRAAHQHPSAIDPDMNAPSIQGRVWVNSAAQALPICVMAICSTRIGKELTALRLRTTKGMRYRFRKECRVMPSRLTWGASPTNSEEMGW